VTAVSYDLAALYAEHRDAMYKVARSVLRKAGRPDLADDAVQDAIESIMAKPPEKIDNPEAFLVLVVKRKAIDLAKAPAVARRADYEEEDHLVDGFEDAAIDRLDTLKRNALTREELAKLPEMEEQVIRQVIMLERRAVEVADELGRSQAWVSKTKKTGMLRLNERLRKGRVA